MKKILSAVFLMLAILTTPAYAFAATLSLSPSTGTFNRGCPAKIDIMLDTTGTNTDGTDVILNYDPSRFTVTTSSITNGTIYADYPGNSVDSTNGKISVSGISSVSSPFNGSGLFATLNVKIADNAPAGAATLTFDFDPNNKTKTTDSNVVERGTIADVLSSVTDGNYTIGTGSCGSIGTAAGAQGGINGTGANGTLTSSSSGSFPVPSPITTLPAGGLFDNTIILSSIGVVLTILGVAGLALL